jgi:predicted metalloprotease with PDZ domain
MKRRWLPTLLLLVAPASNCLSAQNSPVAIEIDATRAPQRIVHSKLTFPVTAGPLTLYYPEWLPGNHRPSGPVANLVNLEMTTDGKPIAWQRDDVDMYAFHLQVPPGVNSLEVALDYVSPSKNGGRFDPVSSDQLAIFNWNLALLYPKGRPAAAYTYKATLRLPPGWKFGTALPVTHASGSNVEFEPVPLTTLVDSPVIAGAHYRSIDLPLSGAPPQELDIAADSAAALQASEETIAHYQQLVAEAAALFNAHHFRRYHFLYTLSDAEGASGLEHHESSDNRAPERSLIDDNLRKLMAGLLPHEFVHSWNGKYRRPAGLATENYQQPMKGNLLWVYEGLTTYLGEILTARSGLYTPDQFREALASTAAAMAHRAGRNWRPLEDTAVSVQTLALANSEWTSLRRSVDYYPESQLIWLEADTLIRQQTGGRHSLDDFCKSFFGPPSGPPTLRTFTFEDVVATLNQVAPYDWAAFFRQRVYSLSPQAPLAGIEHGGWKLEYTGEPNEIEQAAETQFHFIDLQNSLGIVLKPEKSSAAIIDVVSGMPAPGAGIAPGMTLIAVNGRQFSPEVLRDALKSRKPLQLLIENIGYYTTYAVNYTGGPHYPHLVRNPSVPDLLSAIIKPKSLRPQH